MHIRGWTACAVAVTVAALAACTGSAPAPQPRSYTVYFPTGDATLTPEARAVVMEVAGAVHDHPAGAIVVEGRADGGAASDATLADQRALTVIRTLTEDGVAAQSIEKQPSAPPAGETGVAAHQVVIRVVP